MKPHTPYPADSQGCERPFVLEPSELRLDGCTTAVEPLPAQRLARDQRMEAVGLDPHGRGLALAGWAAPLGRVSFLVGSSEPPRAVLARRRLAFRFDHSRDDEIKQFRYSFRHSLLVGG